MAFTAEQQAAIDDATRRYNGKGEDDEERLNEYSEAQQAAIDDATKRYNSAMGVKDIDEQSDMSAGFLAGIDSMQGTGYGLLGLLGDASERYLGVGEGLRDWGFKGYQDNMAEVDDTFRDAYTWDGATDSVGNFIDAGQYYVSRMIPDAVAALGSGGIGAALAKKAISETAEAGIKNKTKDLLGDKIGDKVTAGGIGSVAGVTGQAVGQSTGGIYGQAGEQAIADGGELSDVNLGRVVAGGLAAGTVEAGADILTLGLGGFGVGKNLLEAANKGGITRRVATKGATGAAVESVTEGVQTGIEDMGAGASFGEANFMDPTSMLAGAFGGGGLGAAGGIRKPTNQGTDFVSEQAVQMAEEDAALEQQDREEAEAAGLQQQQELAEQGRVRREAAQSFTPRSEFIKARQAEINTQQEQDILNPDTELGQAFEVHLNEQAIFDTEDIAKAAKDYLKGYQKENNSTDLVNKEYVDALDTHVGNLGRAREVVAQNPAVMDMDDEAFATAAQQDPEVYGVINTLRVAARNAANDDTLGVNAETVVEEATADTPKKPNKREQLRTKAVEQLGETFEQDHPELSQLLSDGKGIYSRGKGKKSRFETMLDKIVAEREKAAAPVEADTTVQPEPTVEPVTDTEEQATPVQAEKAPEAEKVLTGMDAQAVKYATDKLGPNWRTEQPQLVPVLEDKKYAGFQANVDRLAAERPAPTETAVVEPEVVEAEQAPEQTTETAVEEPSVDAEAIAVPEDLKLPNSQKRIYDVIRNAISNDEIDTVLQADGKWNDEKIAELAGVGKGTVATQVGRVLEKIAKANGVVGADGKGDVATIKAGLRATRVKNVEEFDVNATDQVFDNADLGVGSGTLASANQGARDAMDPEDAAFLDNMEETPIQQQTPEQLAAIRAELDTEVRAHRAYTPAKESWDNGFEGDVENESDRISFDSMDSGSRFEWVEHFINFQSGDLDLKALGKEYDDIRRLYIEDTKNAERENADQGRAVESQTDAERVGRDEAEVREAGARPDADESQAGQNPEQLSAAEQNARAAKVKVVTKKKRRVVKPPKNPEEAPEAKRQGDETELNAADTVAEKFRGEVVYQRGGISLVRGYSATDGTPVYLAAQGDSSTRVDIEAFTGDDFTTEQKAELVKAKQEAEAEAQRVHEETPFITFNDGLAFSSNMTPEMQGIVSEWKNIIGLETDVYVTTLADAKADKFNFTGPHRAIGSGTLSDSEFGSTRKMADGSHYIIFDEQVSKVGTLETLAHEMGHVHQKEVFVNATPEMQKDLRVEHRKWLDTQKGATAKELAKALRARQTGKTTDMPDAPADRLANAAYWRSFSEWYADQTARWATTQDKPLTSVENFFSRLGKAMKNFYSQLVNKKYLPSDAFVDYMDQVNHATKRDPISEESEFQSNSMAGSSKVTAEAQDRTAALGNWARDNFGGAGKQLVDDAAEIGRQGVDSLKFLHQYIREVKGRMPAAGTMYQAIKEADKTRQDIRRQVEAIAVRARELKPERLAVVNDFISKSTFFQKWGYDPQFTDDKGNKRVVKEDPIMKAAYNRLTPKEQGIVREIFQHGENMRRRKQEVAKLLGVDKSFFSAAELEGPYAPLKRFGKYAGVLKSQALIDAEKENADTPTPALRKKIDEMKSQEQHYVVSFFDTFGSAKRFTDENGADYATAIPSQRTDDLMADRVTNEEAFQTVLGSLKAADNSLIDPQSKKAFADMVRDLYFESMDERDARRSGSKRKNRAGYEKNMIRSFLSHARAEAGMISTMEHGSDINVALAEARLQSDKDPEALKPVYNMLVAHYKDTLTYQDTAFQRIQDRLAAVNSVYMLTSSIGYHVTNATQPAMVTVPRLAGDFGDYSGAWDKLVSGYKVAVASAKMTKQFETQIDLDKVPPKYRALLEELQLRNLLDVGMEEDLSSFDRFNTGYEALNVASDKLGMVTHKLYQAARLVEAHNRISSAVAAFDMASKKPQVAKRQGMSPAEYAISVVEDTQGNFSRMDAPLVIKALPKLTTQYRKYQLMMAWAYTNAIKQTFKGDTPEMRAMGRRTLMYMTAHAGVFAGATGIPLVSTIAPYILAFSSGEEEPQDLDRWIMQNVPGKAGEVLAKGAFNFIGIDMSTKLSQGKIFDPFPYLDYDVSEDGIKDLVFNLAAGPSGTTMINFTRSAEYFGQGDVLKGIEYMVPKGIRSATESYRIATEGVSFKNGDVVVDPRDVNVWSLFVNSVGLPASEINKIKWTRSQQYELEQYFNDESSRIRREYIDASASRNRSNQLDLRNEWVDLQKQKDRVRPFFGRDYKTLRRQTVSDLLKAPYQQDSRERRARRRFE
ncbi:PLxRFG domain-containing protein [bacterium]|nr:PLxRFG domain-containing protein [bacterium]